MIGSSLPGFGSTFGAEQLGPKQKIGVPKV